MREFVLLAIRGYQRFLSPHKGFCCAYRAHTGRCSCSVLGYRAVRRFGTLDGLAVLRRRMYRCGVAHRRYGSTWPARRPPIAQRGDCDCDFPCDGFGGGGGGRGGGAANFCNGCGGCDFPSGDDRRKRKDSKDQRHVYVPPRRAS